MNTSEQSKCERLNTKKNVIQSYLLTVAKYDTNIYAKRILTYIVAANQNYLEGKRVSGTIINIDEDLFKEREYTIQIKDILLNEEDKNYTRVKKAFDILQERFLKYDDKDIYFKVPFITAVKIEKQKGIAKFRMSELIYKAFSDFSCGYRKYELEMSLSFTSVYSMRLYELFSNQEKPITYTIDSLKDMFQIADKYNKKNDFIKRVIEPARKELDEKSPFSFSYKVNKTGKRFTSITFFPILQQEYVNEELERKELRQQTALTWDLNRHTIDYLKNTMKFSTEEIKRNRDVFKEAQQLFPDFLLELSKLHARSREKNNPKGYVIAALKYKIEDMQQK